MSPPFDCSPFQAELRALFITVTSPASNDDSGDTRVMACDDFVRIVEQKMSEAYDHGLRTSARSERWEPTF